MARRPAARVVWSTQAVGDLQQIAAYIRQYRPRSARLVLSEIRNSAGRLARFPLSGRVVPEYPTHEYREIIVRDYRVIYRPTAEQIRIVTIVHGSRDLPSLMPLEEE